MIISRLGFNSDLYPDYTKSVGINLVDIKGNEYLDLFQNFSSLPFGHNYQPIINFMQQSHDVLAERVPICAFNQTDINDFCERLSCLLPSSFKFASFAENGGLAIEQVIKSYLFLAYRQKKKCRFFVFPSSYHGIVGYSSFLTKAATTAHERLDFLPQNSLEVSQLNNIQQVDYDSNNYINVLFVEPIRCSSGDLPITQAMIDLVKIFSLRSNSFLVYDEIQSGFYATFEPWGYKYLALPDPDVIVFGKRLQVCGFSSNSSLECVFSLSAPKILSSTFDGSLLDFRRGSFLLDYTPVFISNSRKQLTSLIALTAKKLELYLQAIDSSVYGCLLTLRFKDMYDMQRASLSLSLKHILHNPTNPRSIRFRIPLNYTHSDYDKLTSMFFWLPLIFLVYSFT